MTSKDLAKLKKCIRLRSKGSLHSLRKILIGMTFQALNVKYNYSIFKTFIFEKDDSFTKKAKYILVIPRNLSGTNHNKVSAFSWLAQHCSEIVTHFRQWLIIGWERQKGCWDMARKMQLQSDTKVCFALVLLHFKENLIAKFALIQHSPFDL